MCAAHTHIHTLRGFGAGRRWRNPPTAMVHCHRPAWGVQGCRPTPQQPQSTPLHVSLLPAARPYPLNAYDIAARQHTRHRRRAVHTHLLSLTSGKNTEQPEAARSSYTMEVARAGGRSMHEPVQEDQHAEALHEAARTGGVPLPQAHGAGSAACSSGQQGAAGERRRHVSAVEGFKFECAQPACVCMQGNHFMFMFSQCSRLRRAPMRSFPWGPCHLPCHGVVFGLCEPFGLAATSALPRPCHALGSSTASQLQQ